MKRLLVGLVGAFVLVGAVASSGLANEEIRMQRSKQDALYAYENIASDIIRRICNNRDVNLDKNAFALTVDACKNHQSKYDNYSKQISDSTSSAEIRSRELDYLNSVTNIKSTYEVEFARKEFYQIYGRK